MEIKINHDLPEEKALNCAKNLLSELSMNNSDIISNPVQTWENNECKFSFSVKGINLEGTIIVLQDSININSKLPMAFSFFKKKIKETIDNKSREMLANCK